MNPRKRSQENTVIDTGKGSQYKIYQNFINKEDYEVDTDETNPYTNDSRTGNDYFVRKLDIE